MAITIHIGDVIEFGGSTWTVQNVYHSGSFEIDLMRKADGDVCEYVAAKRRFVQIELYTEETVTDGAVQEAAG